jgi:hypothetical protein
MNVIYCFYYLILNALFNFNFIQNKQYFSLNIYGLYNILGIKKRIEFEINKIN